MTVMSIQPIYNECTHIRIGEDRQQSIYDLQCLNKN
jgi:hypothetical protein